MRKGVRPCTHREESISGCDGARAVRLETSGTDRCDRDR